MIPEHLINKVFRICSSEYAIEMNDTSPFICVVSDYEKRTEYFANISKVTSKGIYYFKFVLDKQVKGYITYKKIESSIKK